MFFNEAEEREEMLLLHWGARQDKVRLMYQSWFYNADGNRQGSPEFVQGIDVNNIKSFHLDFDQRSNQVLDININQLLSLMGQDLTKTTINKVSVSHGVWSRVLQKDSNLSSHLNVKSVNLRQVKDVDSTQFLMLNNNAMTFEEADKEMPYFDFAKKNIKN